MIHTSPDDSIERSGADPRLTAETEAVVEARAAGATHAQIAEALRVSTKTVQRMLAQPAVKKEVSQRRIGRMEEVTIRLVTMADDAAGVLADLLRSDDEAVQHRAASQVVALALRMHTRLLADHEVLERLREVEDLHHQAQAVASQMAEYQESFVDRAGAL